MDRCADAGCTASTPQSPQQQQSREYTARLGRTESPAQLRNGVRLVRTARYLQLAAAIVFAAVSCVAAADAVMPSASDAQAHQYAIANALALAAQVQARVTDYRHRNNDFPSSNAEAGINPPQMIATADVKSILVRDAGVVEVTLTATSGVDDGRIVLTPSVAKTSDDRQVEWHCATPSYSSIADMTGGNCEYSKLP